MEKAKHYAPTILRIAMAFLFVWFGVSQIITPTDWVGFVPDSITHILGMSAVTLVFWNGLFEIIAGTMLLLGLWTRIISFILFLHLLDITLMVGLDAIGMRDLALSIATLVVFLNGPDFLTLDHYRRML